MFQYVDLIMHAQLFASSHMQLKFIYKDILKVQVLNFDMLKLPGCYYEC